MISADECGGIIRLSLVGVMLFSCTNHTGMQYLYCFNVAYVGCPAQFRYRRSAHWHPLVGVDTPNCSQLDVNWRCHKSLVIECCFLYHALQTTKCHLCMAHRYLLRTDEVHFPLTWRHKPARMSYWRVTFLWHVIGNWDVLCAWLSYTVTTWALQENRSC